MKKAALFASCLMALLLAIGCGRQKTVSQTVVEDSVPPSTPDSTRYGIIGDGTSMNSLQLVTDTGDTLVLSLMDASDNRTDVQGGLMAGDRVAVIAARCDGENVAEKVINLTSLLGKWTSIDKNFDILEGGTVQSHIKAETRPWTTWKIHNGNIVFNSDTFRINTLGADSLYLENADGIYLYRRQHVAVVPDSH